ncbi:MAG: radical SAM protein [Pantanalinema sp. GBBB05]|nr:radical SAM protein [Pantanalinema sp. GBBB05]
MINQTKTIATEQVVSPISSSKLNKKSLCDYVLNVASGCLHGCTFCYVPSTPVIRMRGKALQEKGVSDPQLDWGDYLFVRDEVPEQLEARLARNPKWKETASGKGVVMLCSGTDPYQNGQTAKVTRACVQVLLNHGKRVRILTRSPLWTKDLDILVHPNVTVGMSLPHLDDNISRQVEPGAPLPSDRLKALEMGKFAGCRLYVAMAPTAPVHGVEDFQRYFDAVLPLNPEVIFWEPINARGSNGKRMIDAGIDWVSQVTTQKQWADNFYSQYNQIIQVLQERSAIHLLHPWFDPALPTIGGVDINSWFYRPTIEQWGE